MVITRRQEVGVGVGWGWGMVGVGVDEAQLKFDIVYEVEVCIEKT